MRKYEAMFIFFVQDKKIADAKAAIQSSFAREGITIEGEEDFGQRTLAYPIQKQSEGRYWRYTLAMEPEKARIAPTLFQHTPEILRTLIVKKTND